MRNFILVLLIILGIAIYNKESVTAVSKTYALVDVAHYDKIQHYYITVKGEKDFPLRLWAVEVS